MKTTVSSHNNTLRHTFVLASLILFVFPFYSCAEESAAVSDLQRAIQMVDATMEKSFTDGNSFRMYDT